MLLVVDPKVVPLTLSSQLTLGMKSVLKLMCDEILYFMELSVPLELLILMFEIEATPNVSLISDALGV